MAGDLSSFCVQGTSAMGTSTRRRDQSVIGDLSVLGTFAVHSAFKQILTDGTGYVLTFTERFTLSDKAVFDAVDKLGSLIARIVLAPLEHSAYLFFSANLRRDVAVDRQAQIFGGTPGIMHSAAHIATGGALLLFVMNHVYQSDVQLTKFISQQFNLAHVSVE
ncbi:Protein RFT1 -like protein [Toxocara canis]|uniref:Protein RFT1 homolog n=1 Tax=Toxocara canis TaxID=6265 RepID=A0A0B2VBP9_TOXCA|nr:Protein RFT1 -like protein [Toxocara canis]